MFVVTSPSEARTARPEHRATALDTVRASGRIALACGLVGTRTRIVDLQEAGGYRLKFPDTGDSALEAVIVNTGGGVAGGDRVSIAVKAREGARVAISTATAERVYRSIGQTTEIEIGLSAGDGAHLNWLPQPTILFAGSRLVRRLSVDLIGSARLLIAEAVVFGRIASGERMGQGLFRDRWRIRRDGRLVFAEETRLDGPVGQLLARPGLARNVRAVAQLIYVASDAEEMRDVLRRALSRCPGTHGVSAWRGMLVLRLLAAGLSEAQCTLQRTLETLTRSGVPRVWQC